jgi:ASC-1-like (ASCH) protein
MHNFHLVIMSQPYLDLILSGRKVIESRFTKVQKVPYRCVNQGDTLFFKVSSGPVIAKARAAAVKNLSDLTPEKMETIKNRYNQQICGPEEYWLMKSHCRYGVLVWLEHVERIEPVTIQKKDQRAWVILSKHAGFGLL